MCAPLRARGRSFGTIYVDSTLRRQPHTAADLKLFHAQAGLMGMAVENHRLFQEAFDARDVQRQLAVARDIQQRLYPKSPWVVGGAEFAGLSEISAQVGGDYFDFLPLNGGRAALGIGDVAGHGIAPALIMSDVRARLRSLLHTQGALAGVYGILNQALCAELAEGMFVALFVAAYDPERRVLEYQNGGHVAPLLYSSRADRVRRIEPNAPALGLFDDISAGPCPTLEVNPNDCLVCFTDGVADRPDPDGDLYGLERLEGVVRRAARAGATATEIAAAIRADSETHAHGRGLRDDFTLLVVRF
jgi:sigma-B regulation protein RsbU (phosphoserine phosphatase)